MFKHVRLKSWCIALESSMSQGEPTELWGVSVGSVLRHCCWVFMLKKLAFPNTELCANEVLVQKGCQEWDC